VSLASRVEGATSQSNSELREVTQFKWQIQAIECGTPLHATTGTSSRIEKKTLKFYDTQGLMNTGYCAL
jgi:hypothetical protein